MTREEAIDIIRNSSFSEHTDELVPLLQPSARVILHPQAEIPEPPQSFFGGQPLLPRDFEWPLWDRRERLQASIDRFGKRTNLWMRQAVEKWKKQLDDGPMPLAFLGQIFLKELNQSAPLQDWPTSGSLAFFYGDTAIPGNKTADRGHCRVIYFPEDVQCRATEFPAALQPSLQYPKLYAIFHREWSLPSEPINLDSNSRFWLDEEYVDFLEEFLPWRVDSDQAPHRCGGHAQVVQGPMEPECQLISEHLSWAEFRSFDPEQRTQLEKRAGHWRMLAQFASDDRLNWMWNDVGLVYFWAPLGDLAAASFDNALALLQST